MDKFVKIPEPTIQRLPLYYRCLSAFRDSEREIISSEDVASNIPGMKASQFRKDLSYFGEFGVQGMGYVVTHLLERISHILKLNQLHFVVLVGAGNLGSALVNFGGFRQWGFHVTRIFDSNPQKVGNRLADLEIEDVATLPRPLDASIGILAVPPGAAMATARLLIESGCKGLLNFSGVKLNLPASVSVRNVDLTNELSILSYKLAAHDLVPGAPISFPHPSHTIEE
jgi:redox-sensing transcriptional repressor